MRRFRGKEKEKIKLKGERKSEQRSEEREREEQVGYSIRTFVLLVLSYSHRFFSHSFNSLNLLF